MDAMRAMLQKRKNGMKYAGMPSYCTASDLVIEACMEQAMRFDDYVLLEATANQVNQFGGYTGMKPADYRDFVYEIADKIADMDNVIIAPTMPYGVCPYHLSFAGTINIGYEGLYMVLHGIVDSLMSQGARRFVVLNGHGGNTPSIDKAALEVYHKGGMMASIDWWSVVAQLDSMFAGGHGDILETSVMMAIDPESVHLEMSQPMNSKGPSENVKDAYIQAVNYKGGLVRLVRDTKEMAPSGWYGPFDPKDSTAELGQAALDTAVEFVKGFLEEMKEFEL